MFDKQTKPKTTITYDIEIGSAGNQTKPNQPITTITHNTGLDLVSQIKCHARYHTIYLSYYDM